MKVIVIKTVEVEVETLEDAISRFKDGKTVSISARDAAQRIAPMPDIRPVPQTIKPK